MFYIIVIHNIMTILGYNNNIIIFYKIVIYSLILCNFTITSSHLYDNNLKYYDRIVICSRWLIGRQLDEVVECLYEPVISPDQPR